jgi:hypothetical protein
MPQLADYSFMNTYYSDQLATLAIKWKRLYSSGLFSLAIDKRDGFNFSIVSFLVLCSNIL